MDRKYLEEFRRNVVHIDRLLRPINQGFLMPIRPTSIFGWFWHIWPIWYCSLWVGIYTYLVFCHGGQAGLSLVSQQIWCMMCVAQLVAKLINGVLQVTKLQDLFKWCEECYTMDYDQEYVPIVNGVFKRTNVYITTWIKLMTGIPVMATFFYVFNPIFMRVRETPTQVSINGNTDWPDHIFVLIYLGEIMHGFCVMCGVSAYDNVFVQFTMSMAYRFRTMKELLELLNYSGQRDNQRDRRILVDLYKMHLSVLNATSVFRSYFFFYGLVQLGTNVLGNCTIFYTLQTTGYDSDCVSILGVSTAQVFVVSAFGQLLQDEASDFGDTLYETNWLAMNTENKKRLLMLMTGSNRVVNIRAGGTYELNLTLFVQIMKAGISLCAVMKAM